MQSSPVSVIIRIKVIGGKTMLTEQRYEIILKLLEEKRSITVTELKDILDTSESTVRRDTQLLTRPED